MSATAASAALKTSLSDLLARHASQGDIEAFLNALPRHERSQQVLGLRGRAVANLYRAVDGAKAVTVEDFVPKGSPENATVIFEGRNSLPAFSRFQKRMARVASGQVVGYNHQVAAPITGPGFFLVRDAHEGSDVPSELYFDYTATLSSVPGEWPKLQSNGKGLSRLVYKDMKDYMRRVADGVVVGAAWKVGKPQDAFFILCQSL